MTIDQLVIMICGALSAWLSQSPVRRTQRWACVFGLFAQPFWMYATFVAGQWGIFVLSFWYTASWARGIKTYWLTARGTL